MDDALGLHGDHPLADLGSHCELHLEAHVAFMAKQEAVQGALLGQFYNQDGSALWRAGDAMKGYEARMPANACHSVSFERDLCSVNPFEHGDLLASPPGRMSEFEGASSTKVVHVLQFLPIYFLQ